MTHNTYPQRRGSYGKVIFTKALTASQDPWRLRAVLKVTKQKVRPKVIFHTESGQGVSTEEVTPGTNL